MPLNPPDLILLDGLTAAGAGPALGIMGTAMRYGIVGAAKPNQNQFPIKFKIYAEYLDTATGGTAVIQVQTSTTVGFGAPTTIYTGTLVMGATAPFYKAFGAGDGLLFSTQVRYIRLNLSSLTGSTAPVVNAYIKLGTL